MKLWAVLFFATAVADLLEMEGLEEFLEGSPRDLSETVLSHSDNPTATLDKKQLRDMYTETGQFLQGSSSTVSKPMFAT